MTFCTPVLKTIACSFLISWFVHNVYVHDEITTWWGEASWNTYSSRPCRFWWANNEQILRTPNQRNAIARSKIGLETSRPGFCFINFRPMWQSPLQMPSVSPAKSAEDFEIIFHSGRWFQYLGIAGFTTVPTGLLTVYSWEIFFCLGWRNLSTEQKWLAAVYGPNFKPSLEFHNIIIM